LQHKRGPAPVHKDGSLSRALRLIAFGCPHFPLNDPCATEALIEEVVRVKPDVLAHLGDGIEANAASQWDDAKELAIELDAEYEAHNAFLERLRKAAPKARRIYRPGNHEANVVRAGRLDKRIRRTCDWRNAKNQSELEHWEVAPEYNYSRQHGATQLGQIWLSHGFETTATQLARQALYFTRNCPFGLLLTAHTHRPAKVREVCYGDLPLNRYYGDVGCLRDLEPEYMKRNRKWGWGHAWFVGDFMELHSPRMSKEWDGEVKIVRMYDERVAA
jgi:predicted phosphodiesterase